MKIPTIAGPSVRSVDLPGYTPRDVQADYSVAKGIRAAGAGLAEVGKAVGSAIEGKLAADAKAKKEADALKEADAMLEQHKQAQRILIGDSSPQGRISDAFDSTGPSAGSAGNRVDTSQGGYLALKGLEASEKSSDVLERLERARQEIADTISSPEVKDRYLRRSAEAQLGYSKQVETHVAKEFEVAKEATLKARESQALGMAETGVADFDSWLLTSRAVESDLRENAPSPEAGEAAVADFRSRNAAKFVEGLQTRGDVRGAYEFAETNKATLGTRYTEVIGPAKKAYEGWQKDQLTKGVAGEVNKAADAARDEFGITTGHALRNSAPTYAENDPRREAAEAALEKQMAIETRKLEDAKKIARNAADLAHLDGRGIPWEAEQFLRRHDPDYLVGLQAKNRADRRAARVEREGTAREKREALTAQANTDKEFLELYNAEILTNPSVTPQEYAVRFAKEKKASSGQDVTVTSLYLAHATRDVAERKESVSTKEGSRSEAALRSFANEQEADFEALLKKKGAVPDTAKVQGLVGKSVIEFNKRTRIKGKPLDEKEIAKLKADMTSAAILDPGVSVLGLFQYGKRTGFGAELVQEPTENTDLTPAGPSLQKSSLPPGRYQSKDNKFFIVDEQGNKRPE